MPYRPYRCNQNRVEYSDKSIMSGQELSQKETKDVITKLGYLIIGLSVMLFASSISDFITQKL